MGFLCVCICTLGAVICIITALRVQMPYTLETHGTTITYTTYMYKLAYNYTATNTLRIKETFAITKTNTLRIKETFAITKTNTLRIKETFAITETKAASGTGC